MHTTAATLAVAAPPGSAGGYCVAQVTYNGNPIAANPLNIYSLKVVSGANSNIPDVLNYNYAFANGTWPWAGSSSAVLTTGSAVLNGAAGNPDSLVIAGIIELMGGSGQPCAIPPLTDPVSGKSVVFRISTPGGQLSTLSGGGSGPYDLGDPQPTQDLVESLLLDGERPFGSRTSNRTLSIPIAIYAPTQQLLGAARDYLLSVIDQQTFQIASTPASTGLTTIYDCFRALPSVMMYGFNNNREGTPASPAIGLVTVAIQALPFGRSGIDGVVEIDFSSNLVAGTPTTSVLTVDDFSGTVDTSEGWLLNTQYPVTGTNCVFHRNPVPVRSPRVPLTYQNQGMSPKNLVGLPVFAVWVGQSYDTQWPSDPSFVSNVTLSCVLTDSNGKTLGFSKTVNKVPWNAMSSKPAWSQIAIPVPQKNAGFSYNSVTGYKITISNFTGGGTPGFIRMHAWLGGVTASPLSIANATTPRAVLYNMYGLTTSARAPITAQVQLPNADPITQEITKTGSFQVPAAVSALQAECWGAGGGGSSVSSNIPGAGGGGGEYATEPSLTVTPGQAIPVTVGTGGSAAQLAATVLTFKTHNVGTTWTCPPNVTSVLVECIAAGAAGAPGGGGGGGGGFGQRTVTTVPGTTYSMWVGGGGSPNTGTTSQAQTSRNGQNSWFGLPGTQYLSGALVGATGGKSPSAGSAEGGLGGVPFNATLGYSGGNGGRSPGGGGGGGGASADDAGPGAPGSASPKLGVSAAGDYLTGGPGGQGGTGGAGPGGAGGNGAPCPGYAGLPVTPGGGGGGGYTKTVSTGSGQLAVNYQGSKGAPGWIRLVYTANAGNPVNGTSTVFGSAATTGTVVTANGGTSAAANSGNGGAGAAGSSNSTHFPGGSGALVQRNGNMIAVAGSNQVSLGTNTVNAGVTCTVSAGSTLSAAFMQAGVMLAAAAVTAHPVTTASVSDSAGNIYYAVPNATKSLSDGSCLQVYVSTLKYAVTSGTVLTLTSGTSNNWAVSWGAVSGVRDLEDTAVAANTGTGTTVSIARTYPDTSAVYYELIVLANGGSSTTQAGLNAAPAASMFTSVSNGTLGLNFAGRIATGSASALTLSGTISSMPWAVVTLPFILTNQNGQAIQTTVNGSANFTSTVSGTITNTVGTPAAVNLDANSGYHIVKLHTAAAATYGVVDSGSNTYSLLKSVACGTQMIYIWGARITHALNAGWTLTASSGTSQSFSMSTFFVPGATAADATGSTSNSATGTAVSLAYPGSTTSSDDFQFLTVGYPNNGDLVTSPAWSTNNTGVKLASVANSTLPANDDFFLYQQSAFGSTTFTATLSSSQTWGACVVSLVTPNISGGGGSSGGTGGAGADGSSGISGGGPSYTFGGKGAGGVLGNTNGAIGAVPGGGGSGSSRTSGSVAYIGGSGGSGMVRVTYNPPLIAFNDFLLHRPGEGAPADFNPLVPIPVGDPPDNREYAVPQTVVGRNAQFGGTYTVMLNAASWDSPGNSRRLSVTVNQYEYYGGPAVGIQATRTLTPATDIVNGYVSMGQVTLPVKSVNSANTDCYYTVSIHCTNQNDAFQDVIFLDSQGQTVLVNIAPGSSGDSRYVNYYVDEPSMDRDLGSVLGSSHERDRAISVLDMAMVTGGPLYVARGTNLLLAYSSKGAPNLQVGFSPRWYAERTQ